MSVIDVYDDIYGDLYGELAGPLTGTYYDEYGKLYGAPDVPVTVPTPIIFNKFEYSGRTTDADPVEYRKNLRGNMLMRHYGPRAVGVNVYVMNDGTITEADPINMAGDCAVVLWGGHENEVDFDLAVRLTDAGYGEWLTGFSGFTDTYQDVYQ